LKTDDKQQQIKEELLGRRMLAQPQDEGRRRRRPHIYEIPFPPDTPQLFLRSPPDAGHQQQQESPREGEDDSAAAGVAAGGRGVGRLPFSQSPCYAASRAFYSRHQERAWISAVPFGVTTNAKLADAYARVLLAYLEDVEKGAERPQEEEAGGEEDREEWEGPRTVHIVEVAAGHGLFGFLLAKRLRELLPPPLPPPLSSPAASPWRVRLIMTDFQRDLLESRRAAPWLRPFVADGSVDFAVLDASPDDDDDDDEKEEGEGKGGIPRSLELLSGRTLRPGCMRGPLLVLGNYALDSLPADVFFKFSSSSSSGSGSGSGNGQSRGAEEDGHEEKEEEERGQSVVRELVVDPTTGRFHLSAPSPARLMSYPHAGLLRAMLARGREGLHVVNVGLLSVLRRLRALLHPANRSAYRQDKTVSLFIERFAGGLH
jgi:hypothetical protein